MSMERPVPEVGTMNPRALSSDHRQPSELFLLSAPDKVWMDQA